jgi:hypothetical protein
MRLPSCIVAITVTAVLCARCDAGSVPPGGSINFPNDQEFVPPTGDLLASDSRTIAITYVAPPGFTFDEDNHTQVQFKSEVRRDPATGKLSFLYQLDAVEEFHTGKEGASATYHSFAGFATDVTGDHKNQDLDVSRSADGSTFDLDGGGMGQGRPPTFAVATDATDFDRNGSFTLTLFDEFFLAKPGEPGNQILGAAGTVQVDSVFEPAAAGPTPIPLAPAAWGGLILMMLLAGGGCGARARIRVSG